MDHDHQLMLHQVLITSPKYDLFITCLSILLVSWVLWSKLQMSQRSRRVLVPPGPMKLPIIGNLHNVAAWGSYLLPHRSMAELAKKYGPVMHLQLGRGATTTIVLSSPEIARQAMKTHDLDFASPDALELLMISPKRALLCFRPVREREVSKLVAEISCNARSVLDLRRVLRSNSYRVFCDIVFGKSGVAAADHQLRKYLTLTQEIIDQSLGGLINSSVSDEMFPSSLHVLLMAGSKLSKFKRLRAEADAVLENVINQHMASARSEEVLEQDVLHLLLNDLKDQDHHHHHHHHQLGFPLTVLDNVKAFLQDLMITGIESSATITEWAMTELLKNPILLHKATKEVRDVFDKQGKNKVDEAGLDQIHYLKLVVQETLRLHPWSPLIPLISRSASKEKIEIIGGHEIPAGARILINAWSIMRNPKYWKYPQAFFPERFINIRNANDDADDHVSSISNFPPGVAMGLVNVELVLANLLNSFDWEMPNGQTNEELSLDEAPGIGIARKEPLQAIPIPIPHQP